MSVDNDDDDDDDDDDVLIKAVAPQWSSFHPPSIWSSFHPPSNNKQSTHRSIDQSIHGE